MPYHSLSEDDSYRLSLLLFGCDLHMVVVGLPMMCCEPIPVVVFLMQLLLLCTRGEASALLTRAGEMFRAVLEQEGWSSRALVNWGKAMVGRAELARDGDAAERLYGAAIDKYEAVLEEEPDSVVTKYR